jgi:hypothetical protein
MLAGLGFWLLNGGFRRLSMVALLIATLALVMGIVLMFRHLHHLGVVEKRHPWCPYRRD